MSGAVKFRFGSRTVVAFVCLFNMDDPEGSDPPKSMGFGREINYDGSDILYLNITAASVPGAKYLAKLKISNTPTLVALGK
jgi:hypothetical protein